MRLHLHSRLTLWSFLIIALTAATVDFSLNYSLRTYLESVLEQQLRRQAAVAGAYLQAARPLKPIPSIAAEIAGRLNVRVTIIASDGRVLGDSELDERQLQAVENHATRPEVLAALRTGSGAVARFSSTMHEEFMYVAIRDQNEIVRLAMPLSQVGGFISGLRYRLLFATLGAAALTVAVGAFVSIRVSRPIRTLARQAERLAAGELSQRLPVIGADDEIARLGMSLNSMAENLSLQISKLRERTERTELILGAMSEGVMVLDSGLRISLGNRALGELLGRSDWSGRTPLEVFRDSRLDAAVRRALAGDAVDPVELRVSNGRILRGHVGPMRFGEGTTGVVVVFHDMTEIRNTEAMRRDFVANVSHEFKTPLTSIRGFAETLLGGAAEDPRLRVEFLETIERNAGYLEALVQDLLMLARLDSEPQVVRQRADIERLIRDQVDRRKAAIEQRGVRTSVECTQREWSVDPAGLSVAVSNLLDNALNYNRIGGEIRVTAAVVDDCCEIRISDTGMGIPAEELPRIFERFYRVDRARSRDNGGTGLGLAIAKHAVENQGGTIVAESVPGKGSTFTIRLRPG